MKKLLVSRFIWAFTAATLVFAAGFGSGVLWEYQSGNALTHHELTEIYRTVHRVDD